MTGSREGFGYDKPLWKQRMGHLLQFLDHKATEKENLRQKPQKNKRKRKGQNQVVTDDQGQAGTSGRRVPVASLVLKGQAQARSPEASGKGFHIGATRPRTPGRRSSQSPQQRHHQSLWQAKTTFSQNNLYQLSPFEFGRCWIPSRSIFGKRTRASINRTSHHHRRQRILDQTILTHTSSPNSRTPLLRRLFFPCTGSSSAQEAIHHTTLEQGITPHRWPELV